MTNTERVRYTSMVYDSSRWDGFEFRPDDIVISTPAKCGTTWTQMIVALLVLQTPDIGNLARVSPWLDMLTRSRDSVMADLDAQTHRRLIKSHTPLDGLPIDPNVTYIFVGRDPRDAFHSWDNHLANMDIMAVLAARERSVGLDDIKDQLAEGAPTTAESEVDRFWNWVDDETPPTETMSLATMLRHLTTFWDARGELNIVTLHYADLLADLEGEMRGLAGRLHITVPEATWPQLVEAATFANMKSKADVFAPNSEEGIWQDNSRFFNKGTSGQWHHLLPTAADQKRYDARVGSLAAPDLIQWLQR